MEQLLWAFDRPRSNELTLVVLDSRGGRNKMYVNGFDVGGSGLVDRRTEARVAIPRSLLFPGHARRADCMNHDIPRFRLWTGTTVQKATCCIGSWTLLYLTLLGPSSTVYCSWWLTKQAPRGARLEQISSSLPSSNLRRGFRRLARKPGCCFVPRKH